MYFHAKTGEEYDLHLHSHSIGLVKANRILVRWTYCSYFVVLGLLNMIHFWLLSITVLLQYC